MQEAGVRRIAIGTGSGINLGELEQIASKNEDVLQVNSYEQLDSKLEEIMKMACEEQYPGKLAKSETRVRNWEVILDRNHDMSVQEKWLYIHVLKPLCTI